MSDFRTCTLFQKSIHFSLPFRPPSRYSVGVLAGVPRRGFGISPGFPGFAVLIRRRKSFSPGRKARVRKRGTKDFTGPTGPTVISRCPHFARDSPGQPGPPTYRGPFVQASYPMTAVSHLPDSAGSDPELYARLLSEGLISLGRAAELLPTSSGRPVKINTIVRWINHGKRGVRLEGTRGAGDHWYTSEAAIGRFLAALSSRR